MVAGKKDESSEESKGRVIGFRRVCVFDVAQTEGKELPELSAVSGDTGDALLKLLDFAASRNIAITSHADLGSASGLSYGGRIELLGGMSDAETVSVLAHELGHELLHKDEKRTKHNANTRELEAEAVAFVVGRCIGLKTGTSSADYIRLYSGDAEALTESLGAVSRASALILAALAA
jgi:hypothetical protein